MQALLYLGNVAGKADAAVPYISLGLKAVPLIAPEFAPTTLELDESLGPISMGLQAAPYVANTASHIADEIDNVIMFSSFGDLTTSSRYITAEKALNDTQILKELLDTVKEDLWP